MFQLTNITDDPYQEHILTVGEKELTFTLRYYPTIQSWFFNFTFDDITYSGFKLSVGVRHLIAYNFPFDFILEDTSLNGLDPFKIDDFSTGRIIIYQLTPEELEEIRGYAVEI